MWKMRTRPSSRDRVSRNRTAVAPSQNSRSSAKARPADRQVRRRVRMAS